MARVDDFFLSPTATGDDRLFLADKRPGTNVTPLVDGVETFRAMESAISSATETVHFSAWIFNPTTPLQARGAVNTALRRRGVRHKVKTWADLLATMAGLGVKVRVILTDFDPILTSWNHQTSWQTFFALRTVAIRWGKANLEVMVSLHDARTSFLASFVLEPRLRGVLTRINSRGVATAHKLVALMPRLWPMIEVDTATGLFRAIEDPDWVTFPASHHQKVCVVDRTTAFCGGLDVSRARVSSRVHDVSVWHDVHVRVDGLVAADMDRSFRERWNREGAAFNAFIGVPSPTGRPLPAVPVTVGVPQPTAAVPPGTGPATAQLWRTLSENGLGRVPTNLRADIRDGYRAAIEHAQSFVYIENQYVRDTRIADWLIDRQEELASQQRQLFVIMVVPVAPEEVSAPGGADPVTNLGLALQHQTITRLRTAFGSRFGVFSIVARAPAPPGTTRHATNSAGSLQIYVHSKTVIVDDEWASIGSANANPRSFEVDTEANIAWFHPPGVRAYRLSLWHELLGQIPGMDGWLPREFVGRWTAIANANAAKTGKAARSRQGFVVPHNPDRFPGEPNAAIPDEFAELVDNDPDPEVVA